MDTDLLKQQSIQLLTNNRLNKLQNNYIMENTPFGSIVMTYNNRTRLFEYYCDTTISNIYVNHAVKQYILTYDCKELWKENTSVQKCSYKGKILNCDLLQNKNKIQSQHSKPISFADYKKMNHFT